MLSKSQTLSTRVLPIINSDRVFFSRKHYCHVAQQSIRLDATIRSNAGLSNDGKFQVERYVRLQSGKVAKVFLKDGKILDDVKIQSPQKAVTVQGEITPGEPIDLKLQIDSLNLNFATLNNIQKVEVKVSNAQTRETENVTFNRTGDILTAQVPTIKAVETVHYDVIFLLVLFVLTMVLMQKVMMAQTNTQNQDPQQAAIQKSMTTVMPVMITVTFLFVPIPAGVLLYLVTSNIFQIIQTVIINKQLEKEEGELSSLAEQLSIKRKKVALDIENRIVAELRELGMKSTVFKSAFTLAPITANGKDEVEFTFSANKGQDVKSLSKTASGGELSRFMLAIKNIFSQIDKTGTLIFDEIDSGISGETGVIVGQKIKNLTKSSQIICITHLPQVASFGDDFFYVSKKEDERSTYTEVKHLQGDEVVSEIARMIGGDKISQVALKHAQEMIDQTKARA